MNPLEATVFQSVVKRVCMALALAAPSIFNTVHFFTIL